MSSLPKAFLEAFELTLGNEGGYSDNPADPGGKTMWGVTERVARKYGYEGLMQDLPRLTAESIAYAEYWEKYSLGLLPDNVAVEVFDAVYSSGDLGIQWLQQALRSVVPGLAVDGVLGTQTAHAATLLDPIKLIGCFLAERLDAMTGFDEWPEFGRGWARRVARMLRKGMGA